MAASPLVHNATNLHQTIMLPPPSVGGFLYYKRRWSTRVNGKKTVWLLSYQFTDKVLWIIWLFLSSIFLMVKPWTLTLAEEKHACSSLDVGAAHFRARSWVIWGYFWLASHSWESSPLFHLLILVILRHTCFSPLCTGNLAFWCGLLLCFAL